MLIAGLGLVGLLAFNYGGGTAPVGVEWSPVARPGDAYTTSLTPSETTTVLTPSENR